MTHSTDREMNAALEADAAMLRAMGQDPGPTLEGSVNLADIVPPRWADSKDATIASQAAEIERLINLVAYAYSEGVVDGSDPNNRYNSWGYSKSRAALQPKEGEQ